MPFCFAIVSQSLSHLTQNHFVERNNNCFIQSTLTINETTHTDTNKAMNDKATDRNKNNTTNETNTNIKKTVTKRSRRGTNSTTNSTTTTTTKGTTWKIIKGPEGELDLPNDEGKIKYISNFLSGEECIKIYEESKMSKSWERTPIKFFGKEVLQPRDTAFFGTKLYSYSDERRLPTGWDEDKPLSDTLKSIGNKIEEVLKLETDYFNVILANRYHHGQDFMGWHSDNEKSLGQQPIIASLSIGMQRRFLIKRKKRFDNVDGGDDGNDDDIKYEYNLNNGSLLIMSGRMQTFYNHSLPKVALSKCNGERLNFTYRHVIDETDHSKRG